MLKKITFVPQTTVETHPTFTSLCKRIFKEGGNRTWVWRKKREIKIQTHTYLCRFLQLCAIMQKFPKPSELSGIHDGLFSRCILKLSESLQNLYNCWCFHLSEHNCLYFSNSRCNINYSARCPPTQDPESSGGIRWGEKIVLATFIEVKSMCSGQSYV